jgi:hypothetical protein
MYVRFGLIFRRLDSQPFSLHRRCLTAWRLYYTKVLATDAVPSRLHSCAVGPFPRHHFVCQIHTSKDSDCVKATWRIGSILTVPLTSSRQPDNTNCAIPPRHLCELLIRLLSSSANTMLCISVWLSCDHPCFSFPSHPNWS